jgi:hypothetical protein
MIEIVAHLLDDVTRHLRSARSIEVSDGITVMNSFESGEVAAYLGHG